MPVQLTGIVTRARGVLDTLRPWLRWWSGELRSLWNDLLDRLLPAARVVTELRVLEEGFELVQRRGRAVLATHALTGTSPLLPAGVRGTRAVLTLPPADVLIRRLRLPAALEPSLRQSLALRLDRDMPLRADLVYFDCAVAARQSQERSIDVDLAIAKRSCVDAWERKLRELELRPIAIGAAAQGAAARFNFLRRRTQELAVTAQAHRWDGPLVAGATLLALAFVATAAWQWRAERRAVDGAIATLRADAEAAQTARRRLLEHVDAIRELRTHTARASLSAALAELTRSMAPGTWIHSLQLRGDELQLGGTSPNAPALVTQLEQSPLFERIVLTSTVSAGLGTGEDRFEVTLRTGETPP